MFRARILIPLFTTLAALSLCEGEDRQPLKAGDVASLHALIKPRPDEEIWLQIPWSVNLWEARKRASAEGKPILLWEMDGHPLGCT